MKRVFKFSVAVMIISLLVAYGQREPVFDDVGIVENSVFKNRTFAGVTEEITADNGKIKAYLMEEHSVPLVTCSFGFDKSGTAYEKKIGAAMLTADIMVNGAGKYSRQELRDVMKEKGIHFGVSAGRDRLTFSFSYVKAFEEEAIKIIKAILYEPHFDDEDLELSKKQFAAARQRQHENPQYLLSKLVKKNFYGNHPYGRENIPEDKILAEVQSDDLRAYLNAVRGKDNLKIGIAGDIESPKATALMEELFGQLPDKADVADLMPFQADFRQPIVADKADFSAQNFVLAVTSGIKRQDKDFYPLYIANYVLGGASGLNSKLNKRVREEKGLTYGIYSILTHTDAADLWQIYYSATPENSQKAKETTKEAYLEFYRNGVSEAELEGAKNALLSSFNLRFSSLLNIAEMLYEIQVDDLGIDFLKKRQDYVNAVTLDEVNGAIKKYLPAALEAREGTRWFEIIGKN